MLRIMTFLKIRIRHIGWFLSLVWRPIHGEPGGGEVIRMNIACAWEVAGGLALTSAKIFS